MHESQRSQESQDEGFAQNRGRIQWVIGICLAAMAGEIAVGTYSHSMALVAEGWHMASHVGALTIALMAYRLARSPRLNEGLTFGTGKLIPLGGYTSAVVLSVVAILIIIESAERFGAPMTISFDQAIVVACIGMGVNLLSTFVLGAGHGHADHKGHDGHDHAAHAHDHNLRGAFMHIATDVFTSLMTVVALVLAKSFGWVFLDPLVGCLGGLVIIAWAYQLLRDTGFELLDGHSNAVDWPQVRARIEGEGAKIVDFHVWRIAPTTLACELVVESPRHRGPGFYRDILENEFSIGHPIVEERHP